VNKPLFSIITVNLNDRDGLEKTIKSVINQSCKDYEYIIIDGKSTDGSVDIIKKYEKDITYWISEKDKGIYDAMNKGANASKGVYIIFLNSSDLFDNPCVLKMVTQKIILRKHNFICGKAVIDYGSYNSLVSNKANKLKYGLMPSHQATFVKKKLFDEIGLFDSTYISSGDFEYFCRYVANNGQIFIIDDVIAKVKAGGLSSDKNINYKETYSIIKKYWGMYFATLFYLRRILLEQGTKKILTRLRLKMILDKVSVINNKIRI